MNNILLVFPLINFRDCRKLSLSLKPSRHIRTPPEASNLSTVYNFWRGLLLSPTKFS
jgi:hypothetical protein